MMPAPPRRRGSTLTAASIGRLRAASASRAALTRQASRCRRLNVRGQQAEGECERLRRELSLVEAQIAGWLGEEQSATAQLGGIQVLYVGGHAPPSGDQPTSGLPVNAERRYHLLKL